MTKIDLWKVAEDISKLQTFILDDEKYVSLPEVLKILNKHTEGKNESIHIGEDNRHE